MDGSRPIINNICSEDKVTVVAIVVWYHALEETHIDPIPPENHSHWVRRCITPS
jgi:hypothetical protein